MKKLLNTRDILLLGLSSALDLFEEIKDPLRAVSRSYENMYGWIPEQYKKHNFNHLVWRSLKTGYIEKIEKRGEIYIRLTSQGNRKITRDFPLFSLQNKKWDKKWRMVIFDIQEVNKSTRESLRKKLKELGFGMIQKSVFISPHDIIQDLSEFVKNSGLDEVVYTFEASNLAIGNVRELASKIWKLNLLNGMYEKILDKIEHGHLINTRDRIKKLNDLEKRDRVKSVRELREDFLRILVQDPFLPEELLPIDWKGRRVRYLIRMLRTE